jgi:metal-responsive CopG/Arc/MetJ family transcriptional regulator
MAKAEISVTIDRSLLRDCDRLARGTSRSEAVEEALSRWVREREPSLPRVNARIIPVWGVTSDHERKFTFHRLDPIHVLD